MLNDYISDVESIDTMIDFSKRYGVEQLTLRPVNKPDITLDYGISKWIEQHSLSDGQKDTIQGYIDDKVAHGSAVVLEKFPFGGRIYDINGQNVCITNSLTRDPDTEQIRQLIFLPPGTITEDWVYPGSVKLRDPKNTNGKLTQKIEMVK